MQGLLIDMTGRRIGRLTVVAVSEKRGMKGQAYWLCRCDCGTEKAIIGSALRDGSSQSCGCASREAALQNSLSRQTHGASQTVEYRTWIKLRSRCSQTSGKNWRLYGSRGIKVCDRWMTSFENFLDDMGSRPSDRHSIDRIDSAGDYEPGNCRWATYSEQNRNTSRNRQITHADATRTMAEWAELSGLPYNILRGRLDQSGWSIEKALSTPYRPYQTRQ